jgi:hypothetical protein
VFTGLPITACKLIQRASPHPVTRMKCLIVFRVKDQLLGPDFLFVQQVTDWQYSASWRTGGARRKTRKEGLEQSEVRAEGESRRLGGFDAEVGHPFSSPMSPCEIL